MSARDDLAQLIWDTFRARYIADDGPSNAAYVREDDPLDEALVDGYVDLLGVADAILARYRLIP
jgi:hypothetical protein